MNRRRFLKNTGVTSAGIGMTGILYLTSMDGETTIISKGRTFEIVGKNKINGEVFSTPAILRHSIIIRTKNHLIKIVDKR